jgi:raffinose/stachyose/melibiose transport system substrate-binding protein
MRHSILMGTTALAAALMTSSAFAATVTLYTWRPQEVPLWQYINDNDVLGADIDVNVVQVQSDNYDVKLRADLQAGEGIDLFQARAGAAWLAPLIEGGVIKPSTTDLSGMAPASIEAGRGADGNVYGVPFAVQMQSVIYNTKVFEDNGIAVPTTPEEFAAAADKFKAAGITPISLSAKATWWNNQVLGETLTAGLVPDELAQKLVSGEACFTDPAFVATLQTAKDWQDKGWLNASPVADDYDVMRTSVALGESAMMVDGAWSSGPASPMYQVDPELKLGFFAIPGENGKVYAFADGTYQVNANSANLETAQKVLDFTATKEFAELFVQYVGELPAYGGEYTVEDPRLQEIANLIATDSAAATPYFAYSLNSGEPSYGTLIASGYQELFSGSITPADLAKKIQDGLNSWNYAGAANCQ